MRKVALITGASRGIGAATALRLARDGFDIAVSYREQTEAAQAIVSAILELGRSAVAIQADIADSSAIEKLFVEAEDRLGGLRCLVNNAAVLRPQARLEAMDADRINTVMNINVTGCFLCCREAVKRMSTAHGGAGGSIVNVSSAAARIGAPNEYIDYAASKGAVDTLTRGLALEVAGEGIRVNAVRPGFIYTDMHADGGEPGRVDRLAPLIPLGRGGQAEEVAAAIAWLASDDASYTTGSFIEVAGGR